MTDSWFGLRFVNVPLINLRWEFRDHYHLVHEPSFESYFSGPIRPIDSPYLRWLGMPDDFLTLILQRAILGIEAYLSGAVYVECGYRGILTNELGAKIHNPFRLGGRKTIDKLYDKLPGLVDPTASLMVSNEGLWKRNAEFYSNVRNPLFHGKQISNSHVPGVREAFDHLAQLYEWIDTWHSPEKILKGASNSFAIKRDATSNSASQPAPASGRG
jgi:hypothetical protein